MFYPRWERNSGCLSARAVAKSLSCLLLYIIVLQKVRETSWVQHDCSAGNSTFIVWRREGGSEVAEGDKLNMTLLHLSEGKF
jgi:hypothetical protein